MNSRMVGEMCVGGTLVQVRVGGMCVGGTLVQVRVGDVCGCEQ